MRAKVVLLLTAIVVASACGGRTIEGDSGVGREAGPDADAADASVTCRTNVVRFAQGVISYSEGCSNGHGYTVTFACAGQVLTCEAASGTETRMLPGGLCDANGNVIGDPFAACGFPG